MTLTSNRDSVICNIHISLFKMDIQSPVDTISGFIIASFITSIVFRAT